jgi:two-component system, OmpR family, sensor histidine kinase PhoQ
VRGLEKVYAAKGVLCEFDIDPGSRFHGEPGDLQELLGNLLENAFKWANRRVLLTAQPQPAPNTRRPGLLLAVDDDGPGIAPEDIAKVLQRGVRGDERGELLVTRSSELGGARFEVRLPAGP